MEIPMFGMKHSLNVSVAFGVCIYPIELDNLRANQMNHISEWFDLGIIVLFSFFALIVASLI